MKIVKEVKIDKSVTFKVCLEKKKKKNSNTKKKKSYFESV